MNLRALAEQDLDFILEDEVTGFGWPIELVDPSGSTSQLKGYSTDIGLSIDPDTGVAVSGRSASVSLRISSLPGGIFPEGVSDPTQKPWVVKFSDINGAPYTFKVSNSMPDRALGLLTLVLETYNA